MPTLVVDRLDLAPPTPHDVLDFSLAKPHPCILAQQVIEALVGPSAKGLILPADRIIETELAQRLGVSQLPARDALLVLDIHGIVINEPCKGTGLAPVTPERIDQLIELRIALETTALSRANRPRRNNAT